MGRSIGTPRPDRKMSTMNPIILGVILMVLLASVAACGGEPTDNEVEDRARAIEVYSDQVVRRMSDCGVDDVDKLMSLGEEMLELERRVGRGGSELSNSDKMDYLDDTEDILKDIEDLC